MALLIKNYVRVKSSLHFIAIQSLSSVGKAHFHFALFNLKLFCGVCHVCISVSLLKITVCVVLIVCSVVCISVCVFVCVWIQTAIEALAVALYLLKHWDLQSR